MARLASKKGHSARLSYEQRKVASQSAKQRRQQMRESVDEVLDMVEHEVARLSTEYKKSRAYFLEQLHQGGRFARRSRDPNIFNAAQHAIGLVEKKSKHESQSYYNIEY
jgi:hypothetical protein